MDVCEICEEVGERDCYHCDLGNPCIGCTDYDEKNDICKSDGGCGKTMEGSEKNESRP